MKIPKEIKEKERIGFYKGNRPCSIYECENIATRSISEQEFVKYLDIIGLKYIKNKSHKLYLCKKHFDVCNKEKKKMEKPIKRTWQLNERKYSDKIKNYNKPQKNFKYQLILIK